MLWMPDLVPISPICESALVGIILMPAVRLGAICQVVYAVT